MKDSADLPSVYQTMNAGFVQQMYEEYLRDPASVDPEWRQLFDNGGRGLDPVEKPAIGNRQSISQQPKRSADRFQPASNAP